MFYSKTTGGFYDESIHGPRQLMMIDPAWQRPIIQVPDPEWDREGEEAPLIEIPDPDAIPAMEMVANPGTLIPADAVEITAERHTELIDGQWQGKRIIADADGFPVLADPPAASAAEILDRIKAKRDATKAGGVKVGTKWYHTDTESRIQHLGLLEKARAARAAGGTDATRLQALGQDIKWKTMDGSFIYLTVKHAEDIFAAVTDLDAASFAAAETHRVAMEASADPAAYDFSVGWPATFAG